MFAAHGQESVWTAGRKSSELGQTRWFSMAGAVQCRLSMVGRAAGQLERYLDLLSVRQKLAASNIANADTPGYRTRDIDFEAEFRKAGGGPPAVIEAAGLPVKNDGNNVSVEREARLLAENALRFNLAASLLRSEIRAIRSAIQEGRG